MREGPKITHSARADAHPPRNSDKPRENGAAPTAGPGRDAERMKRKRMHSQKIVVTGEVTSEPTYNLDPKGVPICNFEVVTFRARKNKTPDTTYHHVSVNGNRAAECACRLKKGDEVTVTGNVRASAALNPEGLPVAALNVYALTVEFSEETLSHA